jgi:hypothetical protein
MDLCEPVSAKIRTAENIRLHLTQYKEHGINGYLDVGNLAGQDGIRLPAPSRYPDAN